jgi:hypothetical protein
MTMACSLSLLRLKRQYVSRVVAIECDAILKQQLALLERDIELVSCLLLVLQLVELGAVIAGCKQNEARPHSIGTALLCVAGWK